MAEKLIKIKLFGRSFNGFNVDPTLGLKPNRIIYGKHTSPAYMSFSAYNEDNIGYFIKGTYETINPSVRRSARRVNGFMPTMRTYIYKVTGSR